MSGERVRAVLGGVTTLSPTRGYSLEGSTPIKQVYAGSMLVATVKGTGAGAVAYTVATDHLTGSNVVSSGSGAVEEVMDYYPYGSVRLDEKAGSFDEKRKYAGHEYDSETGLSYMVARYYDGGIGRFYGQDPVFLGIGNRNILANIVGTKPGYDPQEVILINPQNLNSYAYANNNPLVNIDPTGQLSWKAILFNPVWKQELAAWYLVASFLESKRSSPATASFLRHSLRLNPKDVTISSSNQGTYGNVVNQVQESDEYNTLTTRLIAQAEDNGQSSFSWVGDDQTPDDGNPDNDTLVFSNGDLANGIHGTKRTEVSGSKDSDGNWKITTTIYDVYDYDEFKTSADSYRGSAEATGGNNLAYLSQRTGVVSPYKVTINVNTTIKSK